MSDTITRNKSRLLMFVVAAALFTSALPLAHNRATSYSKAIPAVLPKPVAAQSITYDLCLQDNSNGSNLSLNTTTGDYIFTCGNCVKLTGVGTLGGKSCNISLQDNSPDRRVLATINKCARTGTASLQYPPATMQCTISDSNLAAEACSTDLTPPEAGITAPNGGEIIDTRSSFTISWDSQDSVGVASQDLLFSTDGGTTFSTIATGLSSSVRQYAWTVPLMVNCKTVRVRVVARDAACNKTQDDSDFDLTIWNPPASFTHNAEAPLFFAGPGFTSTIYMTNTSSNPVVVELDPHKPDGNANQNFPSQTLLNAGASATVDVASLYSIGASPENPDFPDLINGGIRLRHNGSKDRDVRAIIVAERDCSEEFTTPFTYAASSLSASGTKQCGAMYYVDDTTDAFVSFQNVTNSAQTVQLTCNYGTGAPGTPNGKFKNQPIVLGPQQSRLVNLRGIQGMFGGAQWGSMEVSTTSPRSVVCHSVMRSVENGVTWDCPFVDPAMSASTTKVAQAVMLDYNNSENAYLMVRNMSALNSRTVTASFKTSNGVVIPPVQVTIAAGAQQMISLNGRQLLSPGASTVADVRLSYIGSPSDIVAAGCSITANEDRAVAVKFVEPATGDGRRLMSPYFRFDEYVSGRVLVSNLGSSAIKAGARMVFANSTSKAVKTPAVTIPAGGVATIDLSSVGDSVPDDVIATGRIDLIHSGPAGTVTAAVTESGCYNSEQVVPLEGGVPLDPLALFPISAVVIPGGCTELDAISDGTVTNPAIATPSGCFGTLIGTFASGPNTFHATLCVPTNCVGEFPVTYTPTGGGGGEGAAGDESTFTVVQTSAAGFSTSLGTRLHPDGTTQFTLTANDPLPNALLQVEFRGGGGSVFTQVQGNGGLSITGTGPVNHVYLGKVKKIFVTQLNPDGTPNTSVARVLKAKNTGAYFALDRPTSITAVTPGAVAATGGTVAITGTGFQTWTLVNEPAPVTPTVLVGKSNLSKHNQIPFKVISVSADQKTITGDVGPTPSTVSTCVEAGVTPCKVFTVINPGGSDGVDNLTSENLLTINAPNAPVITGTAAITVSGASGPATSNSLGSKILQANGQVTTTPIIARIIGRNFLRVISISFGTQLVTVTASNIKSSTEINVTVPAFCVTGMQASVPVTVDDRNNAPVSFANGWIYTPTGPIPLPLLNNLPINKGAFLCGPCETIAITTPPPFPNATTAVDCSYQTPACVGVFGFSTQQHGIESTLYPNANIALLSWTANCGNCLVSGTTYTGFFPANATSSSITVPACLTAKCTR